MESGATGVIVREQERGRVGPPTGHAHVTRQVDREVAPFAVGEVPHRRPRPALALVHDGEALVTRNRRPTGGVEAEAGTVPLLGERHPAPRVEHAESRMDAVAVLAVDEAHARAIARKAADGHIFRVLIEQCGRAITADHVHRVTVLGGAAHHHHAVTDRQACTPRVGQPRNQRLRLR